MFLYFNSFSFPLYLLISYLSSCLIVIYIFFLIPKCKKQLKIVKKPYSNRVDLEASLNR